MKLKKRKGYAMLVNLLIVVMVMGTISSSLAMQQSAYFTGLESGRTALQAQQLAATKANEISVLSYSKATSAASTRAAVAGTTFEREVLVGSEVDLGSNNKKRDITVNVYKPGEAQARFSLPVTLTSQGSSESGGDLPIGAIIIWPVSAMPAQGTWLECNGQSTAAYPALRAAVGNNVPDYRGYFLRGYGGNSASLGTAQGDAIRNITASLNAAGASAWQSPGGAFYLTGSYANCPPQGATSMPTVLNFDASRQVPTANENRPVNKAVRYLIKAA